MVSELISQRAYATDAGTQRFMRRHAYGKADDAYADVFRMRLSSIGVGTYLGAATDEVDDAYEAAIIDAVRRGINVIDTAGNYRCQRGERVVGRALRSLTESGEVYRSELFVASKAGFVPFDGQPPVDIAAYLRECTITRGLAQDGDVIGGCHCMTPAYLQDALDRSLSNLGLETLDVLFLHNPETQLQVIDRETFDDRLRLAFQFLEGAVAAGKIRAYGLATWSALRARPSERDHISLERTMELASEVAGLRHNMRAVQMPLNFAMPEALTRPNQMVRGRMMPALDAVRELGLLALASGPLLQGRLGRQRPMAVPQFEDLVTPAEHALQFARSAPSVTSALVGMATLAHAAENARLLGRPKAPVSWVTAAATVQTGGGAAVM
jgi:aryl-alcohol dehydrogenase-like predicted oxidoreductase